MNQARCAGCHSWHFAVQLDENMNPIEFKCCRCLRLIPVKHFVPVQAKETVIVAKVLPEVKQ